MLGQNRIINIRGKVHTEDDAAEPEEDHRKRFKDAAKEAAGCWRCSRNKRFHILTLNFCELFHLPAGINH